MGEVPKINRRKFIKYIIGTAAALALKEGLEVLLPPEDPNEKEIADVLSAMKSENNRAKASAGRYISQNPTRVLEIKEAFRKKKLESDREPNSSFPQIILSQVSAEKDVSFEIVFQRSGTPNLLFLFPGADNSLEVIDDYWPYLRAEEPHYTIVRMFYGGDSKLHPLLNSPGGLLEGQGKLSFNEAEDALLVLSYLQQIMVLPPDPRLNALGLSYGSFQAARFMTMANLAGIKTDHLVGLSGVYNMFSGADNQTLIEKALRFKAHNQLDRPTIIKNSPWHWINQAGNMMAQDKFKITLAVGDKDDVISPENTDLFNQRLAGIIPHSELVFPGGIHDLYYPSPSPSNIDDKWFDVQKDPIATQMLRERKAELQQTPPQLALAKVLSLKNWVGVK